MCAEKIIAVSNILDSFVIPYFANNCFIGRLVFFFLNFFFSSSHSKHSASQFFTISLLVYVFVIVKKRIYKKIASGQGLESFPIIFFQSFSKNFRVDTKCGRKS